MSGLGRGDVVPKRPCAREWAVTTAHAAEPNRNDLRDTNIAFPRNYYFQNILPLEARLELNQLQGDSIQQLRFFGSFVSGHIPVPLAHFGFTPEKDIGSL
jgi:hypothetical protein